MRCPTPLTRDCLSHGFGGYARRITAAIFLVALLGTALAHHSTRPGLQPGLDRNEAQWLVTANDLRRTAAARPNEQGATITLTLTDAETGQPRPGLLRISRPDGRRIPLSGVINRGIGLRADHPARSWYVIEREATLTVPRGALVIEAFAGLETELTRVAVTVGDDALSVALPLRSFQSMRESGWMSGNTHLHLDGGGKRGVGELSRAQADQYLKSIPRGDGLDLVFVSYLERVNESAKYVTNDYTRSDLALLDGNDLLFGWGQEHRHNLGRGSEGYGHVMFLDLHELVRPVSIGRGIMGTGFDWPPLRRGITQARARSATVVWCHVTGLERVPDWLAGLIDAQNIFDSGAPGSYQEVFYRLLNIGLSVPFSTGTDWFIYDFARVYVRLAQPATTTQWLQELRRGRSFITNGPLLEFTVDDHEPGATIRRTDAGEVLARGRARSRHDFRELELVHNGVVITRVPSRANGGHFVAELRAPVTVTGPGWLALRVPGGATDTDGAVSVSPTVPVRGSGPRNELGEPLFAHTSPVYVEFNSRRLFDRQAAASLIADMEAALARIDALAAFGDSDQRAEVLGLYQSSIGQLKRRLAEAD